MSIYLVQHGKSLSKDQDPERGLSEEGISDVKRIAAVAKGYSVKVTLIEHSGKKRAAQTAQIFADYLHPEKKAKERKGINPLDDVVDLAKDLDSKSNLMLVGHLPFLDKLISLLTTGNSDNSVFQLQNGGIVCLDNPGGKNDWTIKWALMPNVS